MGLVVGRFQPFHLGHKYLFEKAFELCDTLIIVVGSANKTDEKNPYTFEKRKKMIERFLKEEGYSARVKQILPSFDIPDDYLWRNAILKETGPVDVVIGDNEEGSNIFFEEADLPVERVGLFNREFLEGTKIRKNMKEKKPWKKHVPAYLHKDVER